MLGTIDRAISVSRVLPMAPKTVLPCIGTVFTGEPYRLRFTETVNGHPLDGGIQRFSAGRLASDALGNPRRLFARFNGLRYRLEQIELFDLNVTLHSRGSAQRPSCEVIITGDLRPGLRTNLLADWALSSGGALIAGGGATFALTGVMGSMALAALPGAGVAAIAAGGIMAWYRRLFRGALEKAKKELASLLEAVERPIRQEQLFSALPTSLVEDRSEATLT